MSTPLAPPRTLRIKRPRDETPVSALYLDNAPAAPRALLSPTETPPTQKRAKTETSIPAAAPPSYVFRLAHTINPPAQPSSPPKLRDIPTPTSDKKRKAENVRKYTLSKKARMHPYTRVHFERVVEDDNMTGVEAGAPGKPAAPAPSPPPPPPATERKKPRVHPKEKMALRERRMEAFAAEDERLEQEMNAMVLGYLENDEGMKNLPPTEMTKAPLPAGEEDEDGFVYDLYVLEVAPTSGEREASHGVLVFEGTSDQEWWYEEAAKAEDADDSDVYAEDDEDSNAEDYITNDYPDEEVEISDDDLADTDSEGETMFKRPQWRKRTTADDEEYDLENDLSEEDDVDMVNRLERDIMGDSRF